MANRFTRRGPRAQFQPISFEQYLYAPSHAQNKHDSTLKSALANKTQIDNLKWMEDEARGLESQLNKEIDKVTSKINSEGVLNQNTTEQLMDLYNKKEELFGKGSKGEKIAGAAAARQSYIDRLQNSEMSAKSQQEALSVFDKRSTESYKKGNIGYDSRLLATDPGIQDKINKFLESLPASKIEQDTGWRQDPQSLTWRNTVTKETSNGTPNQLAAYASNYIMNDPESMQYFEDQAMVAEELYSSKDELGNTVYGDKTYKPGSFKNEFIKNNISNIANNSGSAYSYQELSRLNNMKNMSAAQSYSYQVDQALANPNLRTAGLFSNSLFNEDAVELAVNPEVLKFKFLNKNGEAQSSNDVVQLLVKSGMNKDNASNLVSSITKDANILSQGPPELLSTAINKFFGDGSIVEKELAKFTIKENFNIEKYSKEETKKLTDAANNKLEILKSQYNATLPEGVPKVQSLKEFKSVYKSLLKEEADILTTTVDYNIPTTDLVAKDIESGDISVLANKSIVVRAANAGSDEVSESGDKAYGFLKEMIANGAKVTSTKRIASGNLVEGRSFQIQKADGTMYNVMTEPLSENERALGQVDRAIFADLQNPTFTGTGEEYYVAHPEIPGVVLSYSAKKVFNYGRLEQKVVIKSYDTDIQRIDNGSREISLGEFIELREKDKREDHKKMYHAQNIINKTGGGI